jgi:hypothetical protein
LERILAHPLFRNSKRYPNLLRYVVERTLDGHPGELKERNLGVEVFSRDPNYDTNLDPVVRTTAAEIRKRLAQYYHDPTHEGELRIDLPIGSYAARFQTTVEKSAPVLTLPVTPVGEPAPAPFIAPAPVAPPPVFAPVPLTRLRPRRWLYRGAVLAIAAALMAVGWKLALPRPALDRLWAPVLESSSPVLVCVGQRAFVARPHSEPESAPLASQVAGPQTSLFQLYYLGSQNVALPDVITLGRLTGLLQAKGKAYHVRGEGSTTFDDVRDGPVVLIGAFNNDWSMRLTGKRRFSFERDGDLFWIKDSQNSSDKSHAVNYALPYLQLTEDFALISRVLDPVTERTVVLAGGLTGYGTMAAGEFLINPAYMETVVGRAPRNWGRKNVQILVSTKVIDGKSGPPRVLTAYFW